MELAETYPLHVVCAWIGNSPRVAAEAYLQVTEAHFKTVQKTTRQTTRSTAEPKGIERKQEDDKCENPGEYEILRNSVGYPVGGTRLELVTSTV